MSKMKEPMVQMGRRGIAAFAAMLMVMACAAGTPAGQSVAEQTKTGEQVITVQGKFYCNIKALTPTERARHKVLSEKLMAARNETIETEKGYEFQFSPENASVTEVAEWVVAESKCCPFFDFHIDLEKEGKLVCLRLTGSEGVKQFMRSEFGVK